MSNKSDSLKNIIGVALGVCIVCSILVATAAVVLKPRPDANKRLDKRRNVLIAGALMEEKDKSVDVEKLFSEKIEQVLIDLKTGDTLPNDKMTGKLSPENFDIKKLAKDPEFNIPLSGDLDKAKLKRIPANMIIYLAKAEGKVSRIIFPVFGQGLWSTMYGFLALNSDLKTVEGITFYDHGETPGLGGEIDNKRWKASWKGKIAFDGSGALQLKVLKGLAPAGSTTEIDGLSGSTLTTRGVDAMVAFWFGEKGFYRPFIDKLKQTPAPPKAVETQEAVETQDAAVATEAAKETEDANE